MSIRLGSQLLAGSSSNDNVSITKNSSNKLQTVGIIDQNDTTKSIKTWVGTRSEYEELVANDEIDYNTVYNITDDKNFTQELLETIYPVGSIYIGTMSICPLSALFGSWQLVSSGKVLQGADENHLPGTTIDAGLPNITGDWSGGMVTCKSSSSTVDVSDISCSGAIAATAAINRTAYPGTSTSSWYMNGGLKIDASLLNSIYGNSDTVQPAAFVVNIWKRVE